MHLDSFSFWDRGYLLYITRSRHIWERMTYPDKVAIAEFTLMNFPRDYILNHYEEDIRADILFRANCRGMPQAFFLDFPYKVFESTRLAYFLQKHPCFVKHLLQVPEQPCCVEFWYSKKVRDRLWSNKSTLALLVAYDETHRREYPIRYRVLFSPVWIDEIKFLSQREKDELLERWIEEERFDALVAALDKLNIDPVELWSRARMGGFYKITDYLIRRYPAMLDSSEWNGVLRYCSRETFELYLDYLPSLALPLRGMLSTRPYRYMHVIPILLRRLFYPAELLGTSEPSLDQVSLYPELRSFLFLESCRKGWVNVARFLAKHFLDNLCIYVQALEYAVAARNWEIIRVIHRLPFPITWELVSDVFSSPREFWLEGFLFFSNYLPPVQGRDLRLEIFQKAPFLLTGKDNSGWSCDEQVRYCLQYLKNSGDPENLPSMTTQTLDLLTRTLYDRPFWRPPIGTFRIWKALFDT